MKVMKVRSYRAPLEFLAALRAFADAHGLSMSAVIRKAVNEYITRNAQPAT